MIFCGICHFNRYYLSYQKEYYRIIDFTRKVQENAEVLADKKNMLYLIDKVPIVNTISIYSLNYNIARVLNDESHCVLTLPEVKYLQDEYTLNYMVNCGVYGMSDYNIQSNRKIDVVLRYLDGPGIGETLKLKILELLNYNAFKNRLFNGKSRLEIILPNSEKFNDCLKLIPI